MWPPSTDWRREKERREVEYRETEREREKGRAVVFGEG
jgi:hypothetical protein